MKRTIALVAAFFITLSLIGSVSAIFAQPADASTKKVKVYNKKSSETGAIVRQVKRGKVSSNGVTVEPGQTKSYTQKTGPGKDGCTLFVPGGWKATIYRQNLLNVSDSKVLKNYDLVDKDMLMRSGQCGGGKWVIKLVQVYRYV